MLSFARAILAEKRKDVTQSAGAADEEDSGGGEVLSEFILRQLEFEQGRRESINKKGIGLITNSTALSTLIFAAAALFTSSKEFTPPVLSTWGLALTFLGFVSAAFTGLMAQRALSWHVVTSRQLSRWRDREDVWENTADNVRWLLAKADIDSLQTLRHGNDRLTDWVVRGQISQFAALAGLTVAIGAIIQANL